MSGGGHVLCMGLLASVGTTSSTAHDESSQAYTSSSTRPATTTNGIAGETSHFTESASSSLPSTKPTTDSDENPTNTTPNVGLDFDLADLTDEQRKKLERISKAHGLDPSTSLPVIDGHLKQALQIVAAKLSLEQQQVLGFQLKDLVSSCIVDGEPCDMMNDFVHTFDVDYGNCYTFNDETPVKYITKRPGSSYGLRMTVFSNASESLPGPSEHGVKVVLHRQDIAPFPNAEGYRASVGQAVSLQVTYGKFSKLGSPNGGCSSLESIARDNQPFYYNGSYTMEGCLRSCYQRNVATACGCADFRFPSPTDMDVPICDPLEPTKYKCMAEYIEANGDYHAVRNCKCYAACEDYGYKAEISESPWPAGGFFYGGLCPRAKKSNSADCANFYRNNAVRLEVSFTQLGYRNIAEEPLTSLWALMNEMVGNSGLWLGFTVVSLTEILLVTTQYGLWAFGVGWFLPEVPRPDQIENAAEDGEESEDEESDSDGEESDGDDPTDGDAAEAASGGDSTGPSGSADKLAYAKPSASSMGPVEQPKNFDNSISERELTRREVLAVMSTEEELYDPEDAYEPVVPVIVLTSELAADHVAHL